MALVAVYPYSVRWGMKVSGEEFKARCRSSRPIKEQVQVSNSIGSKSILKNHLTFDKGGCR